MIPLAIALIVAGGPRAVLSGPEETAVTADGHVVIHFTREGVDATTDEAVAWAEEGIATMWAAYVDGEGWPAPAPDAGIGGDDRLDLYLRALDGNGYAHVESATGSCWMEADPAIAAGLGRATFASVVGHELHHCLQFAITTGLAGWIYEATSTYAQYLLFDGDVALGLARDALWGLRLSGSERAFDDESRTFEYAGMVWVKYLLDRSGGSLLALWQAMALAGDWRAGHEAWLPDTLDDAAAEFAAWNVFACLRDDGLHYVADSAACGSELDVGGVTVTALPASGDGDVLDLHGSDHIELTPDVATADLDVTVTATGRVRAQLVAVAPTGPSSIDAALLEDGAVTTLTAPAWNERLRVVLVVTALDPGATFHWMAAGRGVYTPPDPPDEATGCGCDGGAGGGSPALLALLLALVTRRRH